MPRNVFGGTAVAPKAQPGIEKLVDQGNFTTLRGLSKSDKRLLANPGPAIFIYNVSPIWEWTRAVAGKGSVTIARCKPGQRVAGPLEVPGAVVRDQDIGGGRRAAYVEDGVDMAQDILGCSEEMPGHESANLLNYGCFYLIGKPLEELADAERESIMDAAIARHDQRCTQKVLEADQFWSSPIQKAWITEMYRLCALYLHEVRQEPLRDWVAKRGKQTPVQECPFCGFEVKRGIARCTNCKEILDQELYDRLKSRQSAREPEPEAPVHRPKKKPQPEAE